MRWWLPEPSLTKARYDTEGAWLSNCFSRVGEILQQVETHHNGNSKGAERVRHCMEKAGSLSGHTSPLAGEKIRGEGGVSYSGGGKEGREGGAPPDDNFLYCQMDGSFVSHLFWVARTMCLKLGNL